MEQAQSETRKRFNFIKDGQGSPWYELPLNQASAAARKYFRVSIPLWKTLLQTRKVFHQTQYLRDGYWRS